MQTEPSKADPPKRKRGWFQFSLRTLMIMVTLLAVACGYVAREFNTVKARQRWLGEHSVTADEGGSHITYEVFVHGDKGKYPSVLRRCLGDREVGELEVPRNVRPIQLNEIRLLFPEATIYCVR